MNFSDILIVSDYDYTLTGAEHRIPDNNRREVHRFMESGGRFTIGSGRERRGFSDQMLRDIPHNAPFIVSNGALIYDYEKAERVAVWDLELQAREDLKAYLPLLPEDTVIQLEGPDVTYVPDEVYDRVCHIDGPHSGKPHLPLDEIPAPVCKLYFGVFTATDRYLRSLPERPANTLFTAMPEDIEKVDRIVQILKDHGYTGMRAGSAVYEIPPRGVSKGTAARELQKILCKKVLVCIGDADNDRGMLEMADYAFIPEDSSLAAGGAPFTHCAPSEQGSVADVIRMLEKM